MNLNVIAIGLTISALFAGAFPGAAESRTFNPYHGGRDADPGPDRSEVLRRRFD